MGAPKLNDLEPESSHMSLEEEHEEAVHHDEGPWLISYADLMTLLMGFFALMTSMANFEENQFAQVGDETAKFFGGEVEQPFQKLGDKLKQVIKEKGIDDKVIVRVKKTEIEMIFEGTLFFDSGSIEVKNSAQDVMNQIIDILGKEAPDKRFLIEGHTDSVPISQGIIASNWELSALRASAVARLFGLHNFQRGQIITIGFGDNRPFKFEEDKAPNEPLTQNAQFAKNRRVVLRVMNNLPL